MSSLLRHATAQDRRRPRTGCAARGGFFCFFKRLPMLTSGCKVVPLLGSGGPAKATPHADGAFAVTLFGRRRGRVSLAIQEDPRSPPFFLVELPLLASALHREMASGLVRIALESEAQTHHRRRRRRLAEEHVWAVYCNGRRSGYAVRRKQPTDEERRVMCLLRGVSTGAGVLPASLSEADAAVDAPQADGEMAYMRARFERVVGSRDSESFYMISPDGSAAACGAELSIFLVRPLK